MYYHIREMKTHIHIFGFPYYHISIFIYDICTQYTHSIYVNLIKKNMSLQPQLRIHKRYFSVNKATCDCDFTQTKLAQHYSC